MLTTTAQLVSQAQTDGTAVLAFNAITLEHVEAIAAGASRAGCPVIVQLSENAVRYHGSPSAIAAACLSVMTGADVAMSLHLDHVTDDDLLHAALDCGASSVMYDASTEAYEANVQRTGEAARWGHEHGLFIEAELGAIGGKGGAHTPGVRTDPTEAAAYVAATGVDALAVAVGTEHAMTARTATVDLKLLDRLRERTPVPLVLHGSSGLDPDALAAAAAHGIVKINVGTLLNVAFTAAVREALHSDSSGVDPRRYLAAGRAAAADAVCATLLAVTRPVSTNAEGSP